MSIDGRIDEHRELGIASEAFKDGREQGRRDKEREIADLKQQIETLTQERDARQEEVEHYALTAFRLTARVEALEALLRKIDDYLDDPDESDAIRTGSEAHNEIKAALNHQPTSQWVSVEERLPTAEDADEDNECYGWNGEILERIHFTEITEEAWGFTHFHPKSKAFPPAPPEVSDGD